jgi:hypothetical protein
MDSPEIAIAHLEERAKSNTKRIDEHDKAIVEESTKTDKVKGMKWDKLIDYLFYAIVAFALFKLGLK